MRTSSAEPPAAGRSPPSTPAHASSPRLEVDAAAGGVVEVALPDPHAIRPSVLAVDAGQSPTALVEEAQDGRVATLGPLAGELDVPAHGQRGQHTRGPAPRRRGGPLGGRAG